MTPKEKAIELWEKYFRLNYDWDGVTKDQWAKEGALIAVDEMLGNAGMIWGGRNTETGLTARDEFRKYWQEVKQEIEKL
jgi:zona occludens toxin (predicted ATPase)